MKSVVSIFLFNSRICSLGVSFLILSIPQSVAAQSRDVPVATSGISVQTVDGKHLQSLFDGLKPNSYLVSQLAKYSGKASRAGLQRLHLGEWPPRRMIERRSEAVNRNL